MLGKLIGYEFKASGRLIPLVYLVVGLLAIAGIGLSYTPMYVYTAISFVLLFLAGAAAVIITYIIIVMRFYKGMLGAEGYLAHTLPVTQTQLYFSKMIVSFTWILLGGIVTVLAWIAGFTALVNMLFRELGGPYGYDYYGYPYRYDYFSEELEVVRMFFSGRIIFFFLLMMVVGYVAFIAKLYFCITLSSVRPFQGMGIGASVIAFIVLEIVDAILRTLLTYVFPLSLAFDSYSGWYLSSESLWSQYSSYFYYAPDYSIGIASNFTSILCAVGLPLLTIWMLKRKVNLK